MSKPEALVMRCVCGVRIVIEFNDDGFCENNTCPKCGRHLRPAVTSRRDGLAVFVDALRFKTRYRNNHKPFNEWFKDQKEQEEIANKWGRR